MVIISIILSMFFAIEIGKKSERFGVKQYLLAALLALIPVAAALYHMFTMEKPPLF
jgi:hypothetical protein